jgi:hypothetical protein
VERTMLWQILRWLIGIETLDDEDTRAEMDPDG